MQTVTIAAVVLAVTGALKELLPGVNGNITRLVALLLGAVLGYFGVEGSNILTGALAGLVAVGGATLADRMK